ncbi:13385_t:CDS:2 [Dentiscutata erythropus]|uniref:13385_t:CDS:1 n=1 Tax=Dentiscutata erythropus TaxID=1348616 RepID=A0A9N9D0D4_9GLOM|nr:13385_t:CDS:2 [Dentiscutata erythropus]
MHKDCNNSIINKAIIDSSSEFSSEDVQCSKKTEILASNSKEQSKKRKFRSLQKIDNDPETLKFCKVCNNI